MTLFEWISVRGRAVVNKLAARSASVGVLEADQITVKRLRVLESAEENVTRRVEEMILTDERGGRWRMAVRFDDKGRPKLRLINVQPAKDQITLMAGER